MTPRVEKCHWRSGWPDERLVRECLDGNEEAWCAFIEKYKNLIFSVPLKYGLSHDDAAEIFQEVCLSVLSELPRLRKPKALAAWLIQTTSHKSLHWKRDRARFETSDSIAQEPVELRPKPEEVMRELEREQILREVVAALPPRCMRLVQALFFETPPMPYEQLAAALGLSEGSIGFVRMRCLERLRRRLTEKGCS